MKRSTIRSTEEGEKGSEVELLGEEIIYVGLILLGSISIIMGLRSIALMTTLVLTSVIVCQKISEFLKK